MEKETLTIYDTTLRDGQQTHGVHFSIADKTAITEALDDLGIDYIEAGWPGANPTDSGYFCQTPRVKTATITAFGMTKRAGRSASNDEGLAGLINAATHSVCIVGKTHEFHVREALGITCEENLQCIAESIAHLRSHNIEVIFDAEHFFDGYQNNPKFAVRCLHEALKNGARWVVLCDTNGGTLPSEIYRITREIISEGVPQKRLGIHTHNDSGTAVAGTLAAIDAGACHIQGTLNGIGERCGNADLTSLLPTLLLKEPYRSQFRMNVGLEKLESLTQVSRLLDDILNRLPDKSAPYVGASAFVHKAGLHASAVAKNATTYEHIDPRVVGNQRIIPMSNQAGRSNLMARLKSAGIKIDADDGRLALILSEVKSREEEGYSYDIAQASFELLARRMLGTLPKYFTIQRYSVTVDYTEGEGHRMASSSTAEVGFTVAGEERLSVGNSKDDDGKDRGPVHALALALKNNLGLYQPYIDDMRLVDFKVRITNGGTEAVTRVILDSEDQWGHRWSTIGVSANIIDASFVALTDAILWKLVRDEAPTS